jgi:hypothetical protein
MIANEVDVDAQATPLDAHLVLDDIKVEYHPKSRKPLMTYHIHEYTGWYTSPLISPPPEPWKPFRSHLDFELEELMLDMCSVRFGFCWVCIVRMIVPVEEIMWQFF